MSKVIGVEKPVTPLEPVPAITRVPSRFPPNLASPIRMIGSGFPWFPVGSRRFPRSVPVLRAMQSAAVPVVPAPLKGAGPSGTTARMALPFGVSGRAGTKVPLASGDYSAAARLGQRVHELMGSLASVSAAVRCGCDSHSGGSDA
jgi:hypothetical protein